MSNSKKKTSADNGSIEKASPEAGNEAGNGRHPHSRESSIAGLMEYIEHQGMMQSKWGLNFRAYSLLAKIISNWIVKGQPSTITGLARRERSQLTLTHHHIKSMVHIGLVAFYGNTEYNKCGFYWIPTDTAIELFGFADLVHQCSATGQVV